MLKINKKNEVLRATLYKKIYFKIALTVLTKIFSKKLNKKLNLQMTKYIQNLHPQLFVQNNCTKVRSICILTGRSRSVYRTFKMSRLKLREYASQGYFNGISKAS
jgi:ribosomal protein S14